jgi:O-antigen ligase
VIKFEPKQLMSLVMMAGVSLCLLGIILVMFFPQYGISNVDARTIGAWRGLFVDRNTSAKCLIFLLSPAFVFGYRRPAYPRILFVLLLGVSIFMAHAVTAMIIAFIYVLFMATLYLVRGLERRTALVLGTIAVPMSALLLYAGLPFVSAVLGFFGRDITLTGRTSVWSGVMHAALQRPLLGYGYYAFWQGLTGASANIILTSHWVFGYAHNGILEVLLQLGFVGVLVFVITLLQAVKDAWICFRARRSIGVEWYVGIIFLTVLYNIDEATVVFPNELLTILYIVACCGLSRAAGEVTDDLRRRSRCGGGTLPGDLPTGPAHAVLQY